MLDIPIHCKFQILYRTNFFTEILKMTDFRLKMSLISIKNEFVKKINVFQRTGYVRLQLPKFKLLEKYNTMVHFFV